MTKKRRATLLGLGMASVLGLYSGAFAQSGDTPRINKMIELLENDQPAFGILSFDYSLNNARAMANSGLDFVFIDMEHAPFDVIIVAAAPEEIPQALIDQLAPGGKLVIPVGGARQDLTLVTRDEDGNIHRTSVLPVRFVPMTGEALDR